MQTNTDTPQPKPDSAAAFFDFIKGFAPQYLDLFTASTEEEFEAAFNPILEKSVTMLEENSKGYATLDEDSLSSVLVAGLTIPGFIVSRERHSNGHVDITILINQTTPARVKLGEAKIYGGPAYHIKAIEQLLGRYTGGREMPGFVISYVRKPDIKGITKKLRDELDKKLPELQQGKCEDHILKWSFKTRHKHKSGEVLTLSHVSCNMAP